jgi:hypothetical protein
MNKRKRTTLCGNNATLLESAEQQFKVWLLEQALSWSLRIRRISNDHIELVLVVIQEFESITNVNLDFWVLESDGHAWEVFLGETDDGL